MKKKKKLKRVEFRGEGINCIRCDSQLIYNGCNAHVDEFPKLSKKGGIQIPICSECSVVCPTCGYSETIISHIKKIKTLPKKKPKKKPKKTLFDVENLIQTSDLSDMKNLNFFRKGTVGILDIVFSFDVGTQLAMSDIKRRLGENIPINFGKLEMSLTRLSHLYFSLMVTRLLGLSSYEKKIVKAEIERLFSKKEVTK